MYGDVIDTFVDVLRSSQVAIKNKMAVCVVASDESETVNTTLPAIAVGIEDSENANVFIGGAIADKMNIKLSVMVNLNNSSWTADNKIQSYTITLASKVRNAIELARNDNKFAILQQKYDFCPLYKGFKTFTRVAMRDDFQEEVLVIQLLYVSTVFDKELHTKVNPSAVAKEVDLTGFSGTNQDNVTIIPNNHGQEGN